MKYESCVFDHAEENRIMKEDQNATLNDSKRFMMETDPLNFRTKEIYELNDSRMETSPVTFEAKATDECWNNKIMNDFSGDKENETENARRKDGQNGFLHHLNGWDEDADSLSSQTYDVDNVQRLPEHLVTVEELKHCNESEPRDTSSPNDGASDLVKTETRPFSDKNVLESDHHIVKDICVDEGRTKDKSSIESCEDDISSNMFFQSPIDNNHSEATKALPPETADRHGSIRCGGKEENDCKLVTQGEDSVQTDETNCSATGRYASDSSEGVSLVDKELPVKDNGRRSSLRSFLTTSDAEENNVTELQEQASIAKPISESPTESSAEAGRPEEDVQTSSILYNSKVETGIITFNFNSEHIEKQPVDSEDVNTGTLPDAEKVQCTNDKQSHSVKDGSSDGSLATSNVQEHKFSADGQVQNPIDENQSSRSDDVEGVESNVLKHEPKSTDNVSVVNQLQYDAGETSFSQAGLVTYSGPIAYSGSISYRSESSATSGRSFAFPVLQTEWNSSPVRMAKADRKHKGWRSGLLCCRF